MAKNRSRSPAPDEYAAIEAAVAETERGRWFLEEHARRSRSADLNLLFDAVERLHGLADERPRGTGRGLGTELSAVAALAAEARRQVSALRQERSHAVGRPETLARAADRLRSLAVALEDFGGPPDLFAELTGHADEVSAATANGHLAAQQIAILAEALSRIELSFADVERGPLSRAGLAAPAVRDHASDARVPWAGPAT